MNWPSTFEFLLALTLLEVRSLYDWQVLFPATETVTIYRHPVATN